MDLVERLGGIIPAADKSYGHMLQNINRNIARVDRACVNYYKSSTQFSGVSFDVTDLTPQRSIMRTLAEINNVREALRDAYFRMEKSSNDVARKRHQLENTTDFFDRRDLEIELADLESGQAVSQNYIQGAVRKLNFYVNQYENLLKHIGKDEVTEEDYEREETKYHIMTAMKQALAAARTRNGIIDEGNMIYLFELGINQAHAQFEMIKYLELEQKLLNDGQFPTHELTVKWLEACAELWKDCPKNFIKSRGLEPFDSQSLVRVSASEG